jgi:hypothetical protein
LTNLTTLFTGRKNFKVTLLHPSRSRPEKARKTLDFWLSQSSQQFPIEHILSLDSDDPQLDKYISLFPNSDIGVFPNSCVVEACNRAAKKSTGDIIIYLSDDFKCPNEWDRLILEKFDSFNEPNLIKVDDCLQKFNADVLTIPIINRSLYERLGYFFYPLYKSQFVDQDLYYVCLNSNWIIFAPDLKFPHEHYVNGKSENDDTYKRSAANWNQGKELYAKRKLENFK